MGSRVTKFAILVLLVALMQVSGGGMSIALSSDNSADLNARGAELYENKQWEKASELFHRAYVLSPLNKVIRQNLVNAAMMYAQDLYANGNGKLAEDWLEIAIQAEPMNVRPLNQLGAYLLSEGEVSSAIYRLEEAIELDSENVESHYLLGLAYYKDNDVGAAIDHWEWVYGVDKDYPGLVERLESALRDEETEHNFEGDGSRNFNVTYNRDTKPRQVRQVLDILEEAYRDIGRILNGVYPPTPIQVSLYTSKGFSDTTQVGNHVAALYDGTKIRCPVIDSDGNPIDPEVLRERLTHEYVHVVVRHLAKQNVPWWFNEGLAETLSSEVTDREEKVLSDAYAGRRLFRLDEITPPDTLEALNADQLEIAYAQSHVTVDFLYRKYGPKNVRRMLEALGEGLSAEDALYAAYHMSYTALESQTR